MRWQVRDTLTPARKIRDTDLPFIGQRLRGYRERGVTLAILF